MVFNAAVTNENTDGKTSDFVSILGLKETRIKQVMYEMIAENIIVAEGSNKGRIYKLKT